MYIIMILFNGVDLLLAETLNFRPLQVIMPKNNDRFPAFLLADAKAFCQEQVYSTLMFTWPPTSAAVKRVETKAN